MRRPARRGIALFLVLGVVAVATVGVFMLDRYLKSRIHHEEQTVLHAIGRSLAQSVVAYLDAFIQYEVNERADSPFGEAFRRSAADAAKSQARRHDLTPVVLAAEGFRAGALAELVAQTENPVRGGEPFRFDPRLLRVELSDLAPLSGDLGIDDGDKAGVLTLTGAVACGGRVIEHTMKLRVKVVSVRAPVLSKFTLCVFDLPPGRPADEAYNTVLVSRRGEVASGSPGRPVVLDHATAPSDINRGGWVFLGARDKGEVALNLAAGYEHDGEMFLLYDRDAGQPEPASMTARSAPNPLPDLKGIFPEEERFLAVVNNYWGFHEGMNAQDVFARQFAAGEPLPLSSSSCFRLFGTKGQRSVTRVIGNVVARVPYYAVLATLDPATGLGRHPIAMLKSVEADEFADALIDSFVYTDGTGAAVPGSALLGWPADEFRADRFFCGKPSVYAFFMSDFWSYPYMHNCEFTAPGRTSFSPAAAADPKVVKDGRFVVHVDEFRLQEPGGRTLYAGSLDAFRNGDGALLRRSIERKVVARFPTQEAFFRHCLAPDGALRVPGAVRIERGPLRIDRPLTVRSGGLIALDSGDIEIAAAVRNPSTDPLTVAALAGDLLVSTADPVHASLIALRKAPPGASGGCFRATAPLAVTGSIVAEVFDPEDVPYGGRLAYDPRLDPFGDHPARIYLEDRDMRFAIDHFDPDDRSGGEAR